MITASHVAMDGPMRLDELLIELRPPYAWEPEYHQALLETHSNLLPMRIEKAEQILTARLGALINRKDSGTEIHAVEDALRALRILKNQS
jgi:hypothetical protein